MRVYAPEAIVASVPITPIFPERVAFTAARAPGSITPLTGTMVALALASSAMSAAKRARTARPRGTVFATVLAVAGLLFSAFALVSFAMFWPQLTTRSDCMSGAGTISLSNPIQRLWRDAHAGRHHTVNSVDRSLHSYGMTVMGFPPTDVMI